jgi:hypothetical protein
MKSKFGLVLYGVSAFIVFSILTWLLKLTTHKLPVVDGLFGVFSNNDLLIGAAVALVLVFSHAQKMKLKK